MIGRLGWLAAGTAIGIAAARRMERSPHASSVEAAAAGMLRRARGVVDTVVSDGRAEMRQREARLRTVLAAPPDRRVGDANARRARQAER
jgi:hypothetical protein